MTLRDQEFPIEALSKSRLRLWLRLLKITRMVEGELRENLRTQYDSTLPRFDVMAALYQFPKGLRMSQLSGVLKVSNGNVTGIVDRLVKDNLILRCAVPGDRRALIVQLTEKGKEEFLSQAEEHEKWINDLLSEISLENAEQIIGCIEGLTSANSEKGHKT